MDARFTFFVLTGPGVRLAFWLRFEHERVAYMRPNLDTGWPHPHAQAGFILTSLESILSACFPQRKAWSNLRSSSCR